jgi:hypothetical protein
LLSFVESAPRAYRLKASNAAPSFSTFPGTFPLGVRPGSNKSARRFTQLSETRFLRMATPC